MSRTIGEEKTPQTVPEAKEKPARSAFKENRLEMEARLRREDADARWQRWERLIIVGAATIIVLGACVVWMSIHLSGPPSPGDKQSVTALVGQILAMVLGVVAGRTIKWKV